MHRSLLESLDSEEGPFVPHAPFEVFVVDTVEPVLLVVRRAGEVAQGSDDVVDEFGVARPLGADVPFGFVVPPVALGDPGYDELAVHHVVRVCLPLLPRRAVLVGEGADRVEGLVQGGFHPGLLLRPAIKQQ